MGTMSAAAVGNTTGAVDSLLGMLLGGTGSIDERPAFDPNQFAQISERGDEIMHKIIPIIEYQGLMGQQMALAIPPEPSTTQESANAQPQNQTLAQRADEGDRRAQFTLGMQYMRGEGVVKNTVLAYKWLRLAAAGGEPAALTAADELYLRMNASQRSQAEALLRAYRSEHASAP